jgi:ATP-dependent DNA helicase RecG
MLLDRVQKGQRIDRDEHRGLKAASLVEGRYPNLIVAGAVARAAGEAGRHIRERGFDKRYYLDLILALVREHQPVDRKDVDQLLLTKLPDRLSQEQKLRKVHNLLQELRRSGLIDNRGSRSKPQWVAVEATVAESAR